MNKIIVTESKKTQKRVLKFASGQSFEYIQSIIDSIDKNDNQLGTNRSISVYKAYLQGWRGNDVDNVKPMKPESLISSVISKISKRIKE